MSDFISRNVAFGYQKEAVRGTAIQTAVKWVGKLDFDFLPDIETIDNETGYNHIAGLSGSNIIRRGGAGGFTSLLFDKSIGHHFNLLFGQAPTTTTVAGTGNESVKKHVWALLNNNSHVSYTIHTVEGDVDQLTYPGAILDETTIDIVTDDYAKIASSFMSRKSQAPSTTLVPAYTEENEFLPIHASVAIVAKGGDLDASSVLADVTEAHFTASKNPTKRPSISSDSSDPRNTVIAGNLEIKLYYNSTTFKAYRDNQTKLALRLKVENTDVTIGADQHPTVFIDVPYTKVKEWTPDYGDTEMSTQTISCPVFLDLATGKFLEGTVINLETSY